MSTPPLSIPHSARVEMFLVLDGRTLSVGQLGPNFLLLKEPFPYPPTEATMIAQIDEKEHRWRIILPKGISSESRRVVIAKVG